MFMGLGHSLALNSSNPYSIRLSGSLITRLFSSVATRSQVDSRTSNCDTLKIPTGNLKRCFLNMEVLKMLDFIKMVLGNEEVTWAEVLLGVALALAFWAGLVIVLSI
jgi:hypothetical protein